MGRGLWLLELIAYLIPVGMVSVLNGSIDDGYDGIVGWMWVVGVDHHHRARGRDLVRAQGALLLGGDGGDGPAVPRHPHWLRHGPPARALLS